VPRLIDISQPVSPRSGVWPSDTAFSYEWTWSLKRGDSCNVSAVRFSPHVGTHSDAPRHFIEEAASIAEVELELYCGPCVVLDGPRDRHVKPEDLESVDWDATPRVLIRTHDATANDAPFAFPKNFVSLTPDAAVFLRQRQASLIGLDTPSMDPFDSKDLPSHKILAGAGIAILENLVLGDVPPGSYELMAFPLRWPELDASPVRAVLRTVD